MYRKKKQKSTRVITLRRKTTIKVWEMELPVVSIDDLIKMKKKARRAKDNLDLEALLKLKEF